MKTTHAEDLPNRFQWAMVLIPLMGVLIMGLAASQITGARIHKDGQENLMLARNIARSGIFSLDTYFNRSCSNLKKRSEE